MRLLAANDKRYIIKAVFPTSRIKDMDLLKEIKGFWGATTIINDKRNRQTFLLEKIEEAVILEEWNETDQVDTTDINTDIVEFDITKS